MKTTKKATLTTKQRQRIVRAAIKGVLSDIRDDILYQTDGLRAGGFASYVDLTDAEDQAMCEMTARQEGAILAEIRRGLRGQLTKTIGRICR